VNIEQETDKFNEMMIDLVDKLNENTDCMPNMYEGLKCYPYQIDVKKAGGSIGAKEVTSFLNIGGFIKKLTTNWLMLIFTSFMDDPTYSRKNVIISI